MAQINVNTENLLRLANQLQETSSDIKDDATRIGNVKGNVEAAWRSNSTYIYTEEIDVVNRNLKKLSSEADDIARAIKKYVEEIRRVERENAQILTRS